MKTRQFIVIALAGLVVIFDEIIKRIALSNFPKDGENTEGNRIIEFVVHQNTGIAFDLPVWTPLILVLVVLIIAGLVGLAYKNRNSKPWLAAASIIIALGALGNLIDRIAYGFIVDYIIFPLSGSAFNLSDTVIIAGLVIILFSKRKK